MQKILITIFYRASECFGFIPASKSVYVVVVPCMQTAVGVWKSGDNITSWIPSSTVRRQAGPGACRDPPVFSVHLRRSTGMAVCFLQPHFLCGLWGF